MANATRWFNRRMGLAVAIVASGQGIAGAIWPQIFEQMTAALGWRQTLMLYGIFAMIVMPPMLLLMRGKPPGWDAMGVERKAMRDGGGRFGSLAENLPQILLCMAIFCCCVAMAMPLLHIAAHTQDIGYTSHDGAILLSVIMAISFVGRLGIGALADVIGGFRAMFIASGLQAAGLAFFFPFDGIVPLYIGAVMFGLGFGGLVPIYAVVLRAIYPAHTMGWRVGAILLFGAVGMAVGGQSAGALFDWTGTYRLAFAIGLGFNIANLALVFSVWRLTGGGSKLIRTPAAAGSD
jgi:MFS family permease